MKKPVILWIVAALFLFCSFPFFGEGNIGAGVTFDSRQRVLASLYRDSEGVGIDGSLEECEHEGAPAVRVIAEGDMIGYIRKSDLRKVLPILGRVEDVTITIDNFDDGGSKIYNAEARIVYHI